MATNRKPWKKNLYENQGYEDNYTDPSFLKDLQKNRNVKIYTYKEAICGTTMLSRQISSITIFLIIFYHLYVEKVSPTFMFGLTSLITVVVYMIYIRREFSFSLLLENSKTLLTVLVFGYIFSPMLHTLTNTISTDTIFSMTFFVMFLNLVFYDYGLSAAIVSKSISLNSAIFGSICLASRLASSYHAYVLLVISAEFFVLFPIYSSKIWKPYHLIPLFACCCYFLADISFSVLMTYLVIILFINFICPFIFVQLQQFKENIHGPWDEAIVKDFGS